MIMAMIGLVATAFLVPATSSTPGSGGWGNAAVAHPVWSVHMEDAWSSEVLICSVLLFIAGILCSAAGIGGGGIYVTLLMVVGGLTPHNAVPLSKSIIFAGAIASLIVNLTTKPVEGWTKKSVIDFDTCMIVVPATLIGTFIGVLLNAYVPDFAVICVLNVILLVMGYMVTSTALRQRREELSMERVTESQWSSTGKNQSVPPSNDSRDGPAASLLGKSSSVGKNCKGVFVQGFDEEDEEDVIDEKAPLIKQTETSMHTTAAKAAPKSRRSGDSSSPRLLDILLAVWLLMYVAFSGAFRHHIHACRLEKRGDPASWGSCKHPLLVTIGNSRMETWMSDDTTSFTLQFVVMLAPFVCCVICALYYGIRVQKMARWSSSQIAVLQAAAAMSGILAGLVGIGGGLILSPFFLLMGMEPAVAVGTSATCVLFTAASTTIQYVFTDRVIMTFALVYGTVIVCASFAGTLLVQHIQQAFAHRRSYITFIVALGVVVSSVLAIGELVGVVSRH